MRLRIQTAVIATLLACTTAGCAGSAEEQGRDAAEREIAAGRPVWWVIGGPSADGDTLNLELGLPTQSIGCDPADAAYRDAHNNAIREAHAAGRLMGMTLASKVTTRETVAARFANERGTILHVGDSPVQSPDGRFRVEIAIRDPAEPDHSAWLFVTSPDSGSREPLTFLGAPTARVLFGDDGTTLTVRDDEYRLYSTFDLVGPTRLQVFHDADDPR